MKVEILESFSKHYEEFYGHDDFGTELCKKEEEAADRFDELFKANEIFRTFITTLAQVRGDCFTSDREIASIMLAYEDTAKIMTKRFNEIN